MDKKANLYEIGGMPLEIPVVWDEYSQRYLEDYRSFIANPVFTPEGRPIMLTIEDACRYSQPAKGETECVDCGSCRYYSQTAGTLLGVCELTEALNLPVRVGNDANVAALGEMWAGGGRGASNLIMVTLGTGVGGFTGITDTQRFYINEAGNPVLVFEKYEIAPGALGVQEIEVPAG